MNAATLQLSSQEEARLLSGPKDRYFRRVRERFGVDIVIRELHVQVRGEDDGRREAAARLLAALLERARQLGGRLPPEEVDALLADARREGDGASAVEERPGAPAAPRVLQGYRLRTEGQRRYVSAIDGHDVVFAIGPAGTGKTFLAVLKAVEALKAGRVQRIVLCRPAVEAGEHLGFLPGDFHAKVNPYMRPLYDALYSVLDYETVKRYLEREVVEVCPLAYMRGRTLSRAFIILDEAQNTTRAQMKMFLTRMGEESKIVVTGDVTQVDLPEGTVSGLTHAQGVLKHVRGLAFVELTPRDIVRHVLVERILRAYEAPKARDRRGGGARGR